jgi:ribosomal protein L6P/L9E
MSRIAKYPVELPKGVEASIKSDLITVKGPLGTLTQTLNGDVIVNEDAGKLSFIVANDSRQAKAMSGTLRALVANMVTGVSKGFERKLTLVGVGYRAAVQGNAIKLQLGFSHDVVHPMPEVVKARAFVMLTSTSSSKKPRRNNRANKETSWTKKFPVCVVPYRRVRKSPSCELIASKFSARICTSTQTSFRLKAIASLFQPQRLKQKCVSNSLVKRVVVAILPLHHWLASA